MYALLTRSHFIFFLMAFSALIYLTTFTTPLTARDERGGGGEERFQGGGERGGQRGGEQRGSQGEANERAYHPGQSGAEGGYSDYGHSYSQQDRAGAALGVGAAAGAAGANNANNQNNEQYMPGEQPMQQQPQPAPQPYPYTEQPYQPQ